MSQVILTPVPVNVNAEVRRQRVESARADANALLTWLSIPGVAEKHGIFDAPYLISMLSILLGSCSPDDTVEDINDLVSYVRQTVGAAQA